MRFKTFSKKYFSFGVALLLLTLFFRVGDVMASAEFAFFPASGKYGVGERFSVVINLNTGGTAVNAGTGQINFDNTRLEIESLQRTLSIFSLWAEEPTYSNATGIIKFSGGLPSPGFNGLSGNVFRIVFRAKAEGDARVRILSGSILVNDGKGTNIADRLGSALFTVLPGKAIETPVSRVFSVSDEKSEIPKTAERNLEAPMVTVQAVSLNTGDTLNVDGLGIPQGKVIIYIQQDGGEAVPFFTYAGPDGKFHFTYPQPVTAGKLYVTARNEFSDLQSPLSEPILISVIPPAFLRIGGLIFSYLSIIVTLLSLFVFVSILLISIWWSYRRWRRREGDQISEAEHEVHKSFDSLKSGLRTYRHYLAGSKTIEVMRRREQKTKRELEKGIDDIEIALEKKIDKLK